MRRELRERLALLLAPWLYVPHREEREEAFRDLAEVAYLSRDAVWTSPRVLVTVALRTAERRGSARARVLESCLARLWHAVEFGPDGAREIIEAHLHGPGD